MFVAAFGVALAVSRFNLVLGGLLAVAILVFAGRKILFDCLVGLQRRTVGRLGVIVLTLLISAAPYVLFFDPVDYWPGRRHVARDRQFLFHLERKDDARDATVSGRRSDCDLAGNACF